MPNIEASDDAEYIGRDLRGYPFNKIFPPNQSKYGSHHGGYPTNTQQVFFYDYMIQGYGVIFSFQGEDYTIPEYDNCCLINTSTEQEEVM